MYLFSTNSGNRPGFFSEGKSTFLVVIGPARTGEGQVGYYLQHGIECQGSGLKVKVMGQVQISGAQWSILGARLC